MINSMSPLHYLFALLVPIIWGANFVASKFTLEHFPPVFATALRFAALAVILLPFVPRLKRAQLKPMLLISMLGSAHFIMPQASLAEGLDIATCGILNQLSVPFACLLGVFFLDDKIGRWRTGGLLLAFAGMVVVLGSPHPGASWLGSFYAILAAFFFAIYTLLMKHHRNIGAMQLLAYVCLFGAPQLLLVSLLVERPSFELIETAPSLAWIGFVFTVCISSLIGHGLWNYLIKQHPVSKIAPFALLVPVFGAAIGQLFYREEFTPELFIGGAMTLAGVAVIVVRRPRTLEKAKGI